MAINRYDTMTWTWLARAALAVAVVAVPLRGWSQTDQREDPCGRAAPPEHRRAARALIAQGYAHHEALQFEQAAASYRQALQRWDHPELRLALSRVLFGAARLLEAREHLSVALRCPEALDSDDDRHQARLLMRRLSGQLVELVVDSPDPQTEILFNGAAWFNGSDAPRRSKLGYPGQYVITARRPGYISVTRPVELAAGERATITPHLVSIEDATTRETRWARWKPWAVVGVGVAAGVLGAGLEWRARSSFDAFDRAWDQACTTDIERPGCRESEQPDLIAILDRATLQRRAAIGSFVASGAAVVTGITLLVLNRPRSYRDDAAGTTTLKIVPMLSPDAAGLFRKFSF